ncbi:Arginine hydroxamate resistance protein,arginine repressor,arginine repressor,Arginine repressor, C-terminal domain [Chlamydia serpentis]|uniref:Arginine repressor n=1 Tax=Chlamydia serpentis TaxID=1967782 RepID=A0A2R8FA93_9CHLA|nr:arginine repressor [Chlamydia serpentis]SPN73350.1 Arginine hydroxamate resistance protein,arginine repressor,arginine repressor,Arginine repressor, C-terminal domain [Chlamydia serpentis]
MKKKLTIEETLKEILRLEGAATQEELCEKLSAQGFTTTQSSVSRWLRKIHAVKIPGHHGPSYSLPPSKDNIHAPRLVVSIRHNTYLIVIRTVPGSASWIAGLIDEELKDEVLGTLAGDDTVFVTPVEEQRLLLLVDAIANLLQVFLD